MISDNARSGMQQAPARSLFNALGFTAEELKKPMVGIVSSYNEIVPGHMNIDKITKQYNKALEIKKGDKYAETLKLELSKQRSKSKWTFLKTR